jgi:hypothetical protein
MPAWEWVAANGFLKRCIYGFMNMRNPVKPVANFNSKSALIPASGAFDFRVQPGEGFISPI